MDSSSIGQAVSMPGCNLRGAPPSIDHSGPDQADFADITGPSTGRIATEIRGIQSTGSTLISRDQPKQEYNVVTLFNNPCRQLDEISGGGVG